MRKILIILIIIFLNSSFISANNKIPIKLLNIYDGDTINAEYKKSNIFSIRLYGLDCFETSDIHRAYKQAYINKIKIEDVITKGNIAKKYVENIYLKTKEVSFIFNGVDKYGRVLGILYFDDKNVNEMLLKEKLCMPFYK